MTREEKMLLILAEFLGLEELEVQSYFVVLEMIKQGYRYDYQLEKDYIKNDVEETLEIIRKYKEAKREAKLLLNSFQGKMATNAGYKEPRYYAKIKGWELLDDSSKLFCYFNVVGENNEITTASNYANRTYKTKFTKSEWNRLGINDTNADFEKVLE